VDMTASLKLSVSKGLDADPESGGMVAWSTRVCRLTTAPPESFSLYSYLLVS